MKYIFTLLFSIGFAVSAFAQPVNDECENLVDLGMAPNCTTDIYTNVDATDSSSGPTDNPSCFNGGTTQNDVFFGFTVDAALVDVTISVIGTDMGPNGVSITNPQIALYRGACGGLAELNCVSAAVGETAVSIDVIGLTPGLPYFIRVNDYSSTGTPNWGDFNICVEEYVPDINIGTVAETNACSGTIYDSGGPDGDYANNENLTFTICPTDDTECILLDVESFNIVPGDVLNVYAGNSIADPLIATVAGNSNGGDFQVQSSDACMTLQFVSDGFTSSAGFIANWQCSPLECSGDDFDDPSVTIESIPYSDSSLSTCGAGANIATTPCGTIPFLGGPESVFLYQSPGGLCASIEVTGATPGTGVLVLNGLPGDPGTVCVAQSNVGNISSANFESPGDYYILVANPEGCTDFGLTIVETDCALSPALVDALCNPLNGCIEEGDLTSEFMFEDGFQDVPNTVGVNNGCWFGVGFEPDYYWFTIEAQADGPFGFILSSANIPSDIDFNVWGPFSPEEVCETPQAVIDFVTNNQPVRSSYAGGTEPTGLADIHPTLGYEIEDVYDCDGINDDIVMTIPALEGEVYVVLANDWGNQIQGGGILVDWGPSDPDVLTPLGATVAAADTSVCIGESVQLEVITGLDNIEWIGDNIDELSCTNCFDPVVTPSETQVYQAVLDAVCYTDTLNVTVNVFDLDAGPDITVCTGEVFEIPAGPDFATATYNWDPPVGLTFSCTDCATPTVTADIPGIYDIDVTLTADACNFMDIVTITVLDFTAPAYTVEDDTRICNGETQQIGGDDDPGNVYVWTSIPAMPVDQVANPTVMPDVTTTYFLSVTNGLCPTPSIDSVTVEVTQLPIIDIPETVDPVCQGDTLVLANSTVEDDVTYTFSGLDGIATPDSNATFIVPTMSGVLTLTGERMGCESTDMLDVEVVAIAIDLNQPDTTLICQGESVQVSGAVTPGDATVVWDPAEVSGPSPLLSPETFTIYTATVTIGNCVRADTFAIQVDSLPADMSIMADPMEDTYCQGELVTLSSPTYDPVFYPDITHEWIEIGGETSDSLYNLVLLTADTFTYQRITVNGGCTQIDTIRLDVISNEDIQITPIDPEICEGESIQLSIANSVVGDLEWSPAETLSCDDCPDPMATPNQTTTYQVTSSIEDCEVTSSVTVFVIPDPVLNGAEDETICFGEAVELNLDGGGGQSGTTYQWSTSDNPDVSTEVNPVVNPTVSTTYTGTATNVCGTATDEVIITVIDPGVLLEVNNGIDTIEVCAGFEFDLTANVQNSTNGEESLVWIYDGQSLLGADVTFTAGNTGLATFIYEYGETVAEECEQQSGTVFIQVNEAPEQAIVIDNMMFCFGLDTLITLLSDDGMAEPGVTYEWTSTAGDLFLEADPEVMPTATTTYYLSATLNECVFMDSVTIEIIESATFEIDDMASTNLISDNNPDVDLVSTILGTDSTNVQWTFNDTNIGTGPTINWAPTMGAELDSLPGFVYATLDTGCELLTDSIFIQKLLYQVPNIFSPNGDGTNDVFKPFYLGEMDVVEVMVYNRWGNLVFESSDPANPGWDGRKDGDSEAPSDSYLWIIRVGIDGEILEKTGQLTLVR